MSRTGKLIKNTGIYAIGEICPRLFAFLIFPIYTSHLSPSEYGIINYINTIDTFLSVLSILSLNTYFLVYYYRVEGESAKKRLMGNLSLFVFGFTVLLTLILHVIGPFLFKAWGSNVDFYPYISLGVMTNLFNVVTLLPTCLYRVQERPLPLTILNVLKSLLVMVASVLAVTAMHGGALEVLQYRMYIYILFAFIFVFITRKDVILCVDWKQIKQALKFSLPLIPGALAYYLFNIFDRVLIDKYLSLSDLGIYSTASTLALLLNIVTNGAYKSFEPYFFQTYNTPDFKNRFIIVRDFLLSIVLIGCVFIGVMSKEFFIIFSSQDYHTAYLYVPIILIGVVAYSMGIMYETVIIAREKTLVNTIITIVGAIISISLNVILLERIGIYSAASVFALSFIIVLVAKEYYSKLRINHVRPIITSVLVFVVLFAICFYMNIDNIYISILIKIVICLILSACVFAIMKINPIRVFKELKK